MREEKELVLYRSGKLYLFVGNRKETILIWNKKLNLQGMPSIELWVWFVNTPTGRVAAVCRSSPSLIWRASCSSLEMSPRWWFASFSVLPIKSGFRQVGHEYISFKPWSNLQLFGDGQHSIIVYMLCNYQAYCEKEFYIIPGSQACKMKKVTAM